MNHDRDTLIAAATAAQTLAYAPYSKFHVGAALGFADGSVVTGTNTENASYGLTLCAETNAVAQAMGDGRRRDHLHQGEEKEGEGRRGGLEAVAVIGGMHGAPGPVVTPCGRCRQMLNELAQLGGTDPVVWCAGEGDVLELKLSDLLPYAFGPADLA